MGEQRDEIKSRCCGGLIIYDSERPAFVCLKCGGSIDDWIEADDPILEEFRKIKEAHEKMGDRDPLIGDKL